MLLAPKERRRKQSQLRGLEKALGVKPKNGTCLVLPYLLD
jgi:hypothetical protein